MKYKKRLSLLGREPDETKKKEVGGVLKRARITILESRLLSACILSEKDHEDAVKEINKEISPEALRISGITPLTDVSSIVWKSAGLVLRGGKLKKK